MFGEGSINCFLSVMLSDTGPNMFAGKHVVDRQISIPTYMINIIKCLYMCTLCLLFVKVSTVRDMLF